MNNKKKAHVIESFAPSSGYAVEVSKSGFGRVCPKCYKQWSSRELFMKDTIRGEPMVKETKTKHPITGQLKSEYSRFNVRMHQGCGGENLID